MAPLAQTLALLAMAMATVAIEVVPLDMAQNSFDDQYLNCGDYMTKSLPELQRSDFLRNSEFENQWRNATKEWENKKTPSYPLTQNQAIALMAYTKLYKAFNPAVSEGGSSSRKYRDEFHFKSMHFLLTRALQTLRRPNDCQDVFIGVSGCHFEVKEGDQIRFGLFMPTLLNETLAWDFKVDTMFKVQTCHGADIQKFMYLEMEVVLAWDFKVDTMFKVHTCHGADIQKFMYLEMEVVLIPPFETFKVTAVSKEGNPMYIELRSTGNFSNYDCEWLKGGSLPKNAPHLWGLLLVTMAMAAVSGTL